jgi:hypothetical protein
MVHPPGKKLTRMSLLSGGEKGVVRHQLHLFDLFAQASLFLPDG